VVGVAVDHPMDLLQMKARAEAARVHSGGPSFVRPRSWRPG
jgi:hypothetical protein